MKEPFLLICAVLLGGAFLLTSLAADLRGSPTAKAGCAQCAIKTRAS